jgi:hypothetical protein
MSVNAGSPLCSAQKVSTLPSINDVARVRSIGRVTALRDALASELPENDLCNSGNAYSGTS